MSATVKRKEVLSKAMKDYYVYEHITPVWGDSHDEYLGVVQARTEQSALNKAKKQYKYDRGGVPVRRRISDNFWVKSLGC